MRSAFRVAGMLLLALSMVMDVSFGVYAASPGDIITVAGGISGDNGPATSASLYSPRGVTVDGSGNLYIADYENNRVRKVAAASGIITTVAGTGAGGGFNPFFAGDGGPATSANLRSPTAVSVDSAGNLYIADSNNNRIRKVAVGTGIITTVAGNGTAGFSGDGGEATSASLYSPKGVTVDSAGNLYIADSSNNRIRKVAADSGIISTVAGNGTATFAGDNGAATSASLYLPQGVAFDSAGNLYIADSYNNRIRKVTVGSGVITTVAGNGTAAFAGDNGPASGASIKYPNGVTVDSSGNLYIAEGNSQRIRKVAAESGIISTVAGTGVRDFAGDSGAATSASLKNPYGVTVDSAGNLYIADSSNNRIRKVAADSGIISTVAGNGTPTIGDNGTATSANLYYPRGVTVDSSGNLLIADQSNHRIRKVAVGTGIITTVAGNGTAAFAGDNGAATAASLYFPKGVTLDSSGNLYIADQSSNRIRKVDAVSGIITTVAGNGAAGFAGDGGAATAASLYNPRGVTVDSSGNLFIADSGNARIRKVAADSGIITTVAGTGTAAFAGDNGAATSAGLVPEGVTIDRAGNLYVADYSNHRLRKVAVDSGIITTVAGNGTSGFSGDGGAATSASVTYPYGVTVDSSGNLYIADNSNRIRKVAADSGIISTVAGNGTVAFAGDGGPATSASLAIPEGVTVDGAGNLYIADYYNNRIRKVIKPAPTSATISYAPSGPYKPGDQVTITATFNDLVSDLAAVQIALDGANTLAASTMTRVDYSHYSYSYTVTAGNGSVTVSLPSGMDVNGVPLSATPASGATFTVIAPATVPDAPSAPSATAGNSQATVSFLAPVFNGNSAITGYTVTSNPAGGVDSNAGTTGLSHIITGLTNGVAYSFTVSAENAVGTGAPSASSNSVIPATVPGAPVMGAASVGNGQVTVSFTAPASNGNSAITGYTVTSNPAGGVDSNAGTTGLSHIITGLTKGAAYTFTVTATNAIGAGAPSLPSNSIVASTPTLTVTIAGTGTGTVTSAPAGIACASGSATGCSANFSGGSVSLTATPSADSTFDGWSGICSGTAGCTAAMDADKSVTATFTLAPLVKIGPTSYPTLQAAYDTATDGAVIQMIEGGNTFSLTANRAISVIIEGGYKADYSASVGETTIDGRINVRSGTVRTEWVNVK